MSDREKKTGSVRFTSGYSDIPLSFGDRPSARPEKAVPEPIRKMREAIFLRRNDPAQEAQNFYVQGKLMSSYEDDYEYRGRFLRFYPTYETMSTEQLRGYFSWRTKWRRLENAALPADAADAVISGPGEAQRVLSFACLHAYELINNTDDLRPEEGYRRLGLLSQQVGKYDMRFQIQLKRWMYDYVIYYNMDRSYLKEGLDTVRDRNIQTLEAFERGLKETPANATENADVHRIFQAISLLSARDPMKSPFYRKYPEELEQAVVRSYAAVSRWYQKNRRGMLVNWSYGSRDTFPCMLFHGAVFYDHLKYKDYEYDVSPAVTYRCRNGEWTCRKYRPAAEASPLFGGICHETERLLRDAVGFRPKLKDRSAEYLFSSLIDRTVREFLEEKRKAAEEAARPKVTIDLTRLDAIRRDAAQTRDQLIVDEEESGGETAEKRAIPGSAAAESRAKETATESAAEQAVSERALIESTADQAAAGAPSAEECAPESAADAERVQKKAPEPEPPDSGGQPLLTPLQVQFLRALLDGGSGKAFFASHPEIRSAGIFVDTINEALYDEIGDTVLEFDGDVPRLIEDYKDELEALL